ncbi:hypothetical protein Tco_1563101, partial [Tanacetum coccineum]
LVDDLDAVANGYSCVRSYVRGESGGEKIKKPGLLNWSKLRVKITRLHDNHISDLDTSSRHKMDEVEQSRCMTRISTEELFLPFEEPEGEFRSSKKLFKTPSIHESISPKFNLFSDLEENSEEEVVGTMPETMEEYMSKTRGDYGSGRLDHEDANMHIEKVLEIVDLFHILNITKDQIMLRAFLMSLTGVASHWLRNEPSGLITTWEALKTKFLSKYCPPARTVKKIEEINNFHQESDVNLYRAWERFKEILMKCPQHYLMDMQEVTLFYNGLDVLTRQILDLKGAIPTKTAPDAKVAIQEMAEYSQKEIKKVNEKVYAAQVGRELCKGPHYTKDCPLKEEGKTLEEAYYTQFGVPFLQGEQYRAAGPRFYLRNTANPSHEENSNMIKEIQASTDAAIRNQRVSIKTLEIQIGQISKVLQERGFESLPSFTKTNSRDHFKSISIAVETNTTLIRHIGSTRYAASNPQNSKLFFVPSQMTIPFPSRLNNYWCDEKKGSYGLQYFDAYSNRATLFDDSLPQKEKDPGSFTLPYRTVKHPKRIAENVLVGIGKFVFPVDFIILYMSEDINVPLILEISFLSTAHVKVDVFKRNITLRVGDENIIFKSVKPTSSLIKKVYMLGLRERMDLDLEARLIGETLILNRSFDPLNGDCIELKDLNEPLELRRNRVNDLEPTIKEVMENMDIYCDKEIGDIIIGEPFFKVSSVEARRFDGLITIYNGDDNVTYQMMRSHPRFKHLSNEQCNKITPLLKVGTQDKLNGISHSYQKLKGFYKGVLNLGPEFIRDAKFEEWLTRGHISVQKMK